MQLGKGRLLKERKHTAVFCSRRGLVPGPVETALRLPCDLHGKRNGKEQVKQPYPAGILSLGCTDNIRLPVQQNLYSLIQFPKGYWSHKGSTTIAPGDPLSSPATAFLAVASNSYSLVPQPNIHTQAATKCPSWPTSQGPPHTQ